MAVALRPGFLNKYWPEAVINFLLPIELRSSPSLSDEDLEVQEIRGLVHQLPIGLSIDSEPCSEQQAAYHLFYHMADIWHTQATMPPSICLLLCALASSV